MVEEPRDMDAISSESVAHAFAAVPRHQFAPCQPLEPALAADSAMKVKRVSEGTTPSCSSVAHILAVMLEQATAQFTGSDTVLGSRHLSWNIQHRLALLDVWPGAPGLAISGASGDHYDARSWVAAPFL